MHSPRSHSLRKLPNVRSTEGVNGIGFLHFQPSRSRLHRAAFLRNCGRYLLLGVRSLVSKWFVSRRLNEAGLVLFLLARLKNNPAWFALPLKLCRRFMAEQTKRVLLPDKIERRSWSTMNPNKYLRERKTQNFRRRHRTLCDDGGMVAKGNHTESHTISEE